jgi:hypothetical protein
METPHKGLLLRPKQPDHWELGSGKATEKFGAAPLNPSGDWTAYKPADEAQSRPGFDTEGCAVFATLKAWITLATYLGFDFPKDASERYTGALAGTGPGGTDPHEVAEVTRVTAGMVPQAIMPWTPDITTLEAYYDKAMAERNLPFGRSLLDGFELGYEWVFAFGSSYTPEQKQALLQTALKRGTVCVSVDGDYRFNGPYLTKTPGAIDSHFVLLLKHDGQHATIHDQYEPFVKELDTNYDHNAAIVYFLQRKTPAAPSFWSRLWANFRQLWEAS